MRIRRSVVGVGMAWVTLAVVMTWPLARRATSSLPADLGDPLLNTWILAWAAERLPHALTGWWDAAVLYPYHDTLAFSEHLLGVALFTAPLQWVSGNPVLAYNAAFLGSFVLAGAGVYALTSELGLEPAPAALAGVLFAYSPYRFEQQSHLQVLMAGWMPVCLWALHRFVRRGATRDLVWFALAFLLQALSNGYYLFFLFVPVVLIVGGAVSGRLVTAKHLYKLALACGAIVLALVPFVVAYMRVRHVYGLQRSVDETVVFSADLLSYLGIEPAWTRPWPAERMLWPGWVAAGGALVAAAGAFRASAGTPWRRIRPFVALALVGLAVIGVLVQIPAVATVAVLGLLGVLCVPFPRGTIGVYLLVALMAGLLSLGPSPTAAGRPFLSFGPYLWLYWIVPGFDGLRVSARFGVLVHLAMAVLAGFGVATITGRFSPRMRAIVALTLAAVAIALVHRPMAMATVGPGGRPDNAPVYEWLAQQPGGAVLELPIEAAGATTIRSFAYEYATLIHHNRIVNGATGYSSPLQDFLAGSASPLVDGARGADVVAMLQAMDVRHVIIHDAGWPGPHDVRTLVTLMQSAGEEVAGTKTFDGAVVVTLRQHAPPARDAAAGALVDADGIRWSASDQTERLPLIIDGNPETRWLSGRPQQGDEWVALTFDAPRDIGELLFRVHPRSLVDYPRELTVESVDASGPARVVFVGNVLPLLGRGFLESDATIPMRVFLGPNRSTTLRIRQTAAWRTYFWSVDELLVYERAR